MRRWSFRDPRLRFWITLDLAHFIQIVYSKNHNNRGKVIKVKFIAYMYHAYFIYSSANEYLGCFHVLGVVNSASGNTGVHVSFQTMFFYKYMPRNGISGSYGSSIFSFLRNVYMMEYYPAIKKNEITPFAAAQMDLQSIILSEVSQRKTHVV